MQPVDAAMILIVASLIFGPKSLPEVGRQLRQAMWELREIIGRR